MSAVVSPTQSSLSVCLLGPLDIRIDGNRMGPIRSRKEQWLIALLILRNDRYVPREWLAETLWPDNSNTQSLAYLRRAVYMLRKALKVEAHRLCGEGSRTLRFAQAGAFIDLVEFDAAVKRGGPNDLKVAVDLYRGPLLEGCDEEWVTADRQVREQSFVTALEQLALHERRLQNLQAEIACLQRLILHDPFRESAYRALMQAYSDDGNHSAMVTVYRDLRLMLRRELNSVPDPSTAALYETLRSEPRPLSPGRVAARIAASSGGPTPGQLPGDSGYDSHIKLSARRPLPRPLTRLIGREQEVIDVEAAITASRLVTLTGAGGVGKSRLAIHMATALEEQFRDGVCYVDLSGLSDSHLVAQTVAVSLGYTTSTDPSVIKSLINHLASKHLLMLMDGCEHLIQACASILHTLLESCSMIRIVATSQQPIGLAGEFVWRTPTLPLPSLQTTPIPGISAADALSYAGIALFVERGVTRRADFLLSDTNVAAVVQVCKRLDGIPLAIELAAARLTVLSVEQIAVKLDDRFRFLTSGSRTALPRQQTLRAALDWSYELLDPSEQRVLQRMGVLAGGGTLEAVEALCGDDAELEVSTLDLVQQLVDKSFVWTVHAGGTIRYRLPETTREYVLEKLRAGGDMESVRRSHCAVYIAQLEGAWSNLAGNNARRGWDWLDAEGDNLRAVLDWLLRPDATEEEIRQCQVMITTRLYGLWQGRSHSGEGRYWTERALARDSTQTSERIRLAMAAGYVALRQGEIQVAESYFESSTAAFRATGDQSGLLKGLNGLGKVAEYIGDYQKAGALYAECLAGFQALGDSAMVSACNNNMGNAAMMAGDYAAARYYHEQCLAYARKGGNLTDAAWCLDNLAEVYLAEGDLVNARRLFKESLAAFAQADFRPGVADCIQGLGEAACVRPDDVAGARAAARLFGAAERMRVVSGVAMLLADLRLYEVAIQQTRLALAGSEFDEEWAKGRDLTDDDAIKFAHEYDGDRQQS